MRKFLIILSVLFLVSCNNNTVTIPKDEYENLKGIIKPEYPKPFKFKEPAFGANWADWSIIEGQDGHEYLVNSKIDGFAFCHYPNCKLCLKRDSL